jgi:hypothetical protein
MVHLSKQFGGLTERIQLAQFIILCLAVFNPRPGALSIHDLWIEILSCPLSTPPLAFDQSSTEFTNHACEVSLVSVAQMGPISKRIPGSRSLRGELAEQGCLSSPARFSFFLSTRKSELYRSEHFRESGKTTVAGNSIKATHDCTSKADDNTLHC